MINYQSALMTSLVGFGGACALAKGIKDLVNPEINDKKLAKTEIAAGSVALLYTALKIGSYAIDFSFITDKRTIIDEDFLEKKILNKKNLYIQTAINSFFAGAIIPTLFCGCVCPILCSAACCDLLMALKRFR